MNDERLFYTLALSRVPRVGGKSAKKLIKHFGSAKNVFNSFDKKDALEDNLVLSNSIKNNLKNSNKFFLDAEREIEYINRNDISYLYFEDDNYPHRLKFCEDAPVLLFQRGNIDLTNPRCISIVGTRRMTAYGRDICEKLIESLKPFNPIIVSGLAYGVDIWAHEVAMKNGLQAIACLAHGLHTIYPDRHKVYKDKIESNGGFFTEFWTMDKIIASQFVSRNRIIAGLSEATIVIESARKGGALITAEMANSYGRDVFAVPGRTTDIYSMGCNYLIHNQIAQTITNPQCLSKSLNWEHEPQKKIMQQSLFVSLTNEEKKVHYYLIENGKSSVDNLSIVLKYSLQKLFPMLLEMEIKGVIRPLPGKMYEAI